ncbi:MAG: PAS domain S-box protein, partial [Candidatus Sericytochromatia bacterium]
GTSGQTRHWLASHYPVCQAGVVIGIGVIVKDLTERRQAEAAQQASEAYYRKLFDYAPDGIVIADSESYYLDANPSICQMLGYSAQELIGLHASDILTPPEIAYIAPTVNALNANLDHYREWQFRRKDGSCFEAEVIASRLPDGNLLGMIRDISWRKQADSRIRQLNRIYAVLSEINHTIVREKHPQTLLETACRIAVEKGQLLMAWIGLRDAEDQQLKVVAHAGASADTIAIVSSLLGDNEHPCECVFTLHALMSGKHGHCPDIEHDARAASWRQEGLQRGYRAMVSLPLKSAGKVIGTFNLYAGQPGFFTAEEMLLLDEIAMDIGFGLEVIEREADLRLRDRAIQAVSQGIMISDCGRPEQPIIFVSPGFEQITGYRAAEVSGKNWRLLLGKDTDPEAISQLEQAIAAGRGCTVEWLNYRQDGSSFWNHLTLSALRDQSGELTHLIGVLTDVTGRRQLENQFHQSQKMEAVGQLAGGVAHDFNNLLTIITGYSELLLQSTAEDDPKRELLHEIHNAGQRSASLTRQLLAFSRKQVLAPRLLDLNQVVRDTEKMLRRMIGADIQLTTVLHSQLDDVRADPGQIGQVLLNLAVNARDAMPEGGRLVLETGRLELSEPCPDTGMPAGPYVLLSVKDTGSGISDEVMRHLFEPFFTTKEAGKGTGLGLAVVHGIIKQSGGYIKVSSKAGQGSHFVIYLPGLKKTPGSEPVPTLDAPLPGHETILLVEDEAAVRALTRFTLQEQGYKVLEASRGEEALHLARAHREPIHLLITDVIMPGISAKLLAESITALHPETRVLYVSGYSDDIVLGLSDTPVSFLLKPFSSIELGQKVRQSLSS